MADVENCEMMPFGRKNGNGMVLRHYSIKECKSREIKGCTFINY